MKIIVRIPELRQIARAQPSTALLRQFVLPHLVQQVHKRLVLLTKHMIQFHIRRLDLLHDLGIEEVRAVVILAHRLFVIPPGHYRRQLIQITYHHHLHAAKRYIPPILVAPEYCIDRIQHIGSHHTYLIDHQRLQVIKHVSLALRQPLLGKQLPIRLRGRHECADRQLKQ